MNITALFWETLDGTTSRIPARHSSVNFPESTSRARRTATAMRRPRRGTVCRPADAPAACRSMARGVIAVRWGVSAIQPAIVARWPQTATPRRRPTSAAMDISARVSANQVPPGRGVRRACLTTRIGPPAGFAASQATATDMRRRRLAMALLVLAHASKITLASLATVVADASRDILDA